MNAARFHADAPMKTAEQHAADIMAEGDGGAIVRHLREYARDQRHMCAEAMRGKPYARLARSVVLNALEPGS
jgi:hypothetical protein